jgi:D-serine deaminase-like pyridoxal phosphate-dependent protein
MPSDLPQLDTPCLVVDRTKVAGNAARLAARLDRLGVPLRLHVKTAKSLAAAELVLGGRGQHAGYSVTDSGREVAASWTWFAGW